MIKLPRFASPRLTVLLAIASVVEMLAIDMYIPALPSLQKGLRVTAGMAQSTVSFFLIGTGIGQAVYGPLLERYGRRRPLLSGMIAFVVGSFLCAISGNIVPFLAGRLLQSIGAAAVIVTPRAIIADVYEGREAAKIFAILSQIVMICPIVAPIIGATLLRYFDWRSTFSALTLGGAIVFLVSWRFLPETLALSARASKTPFQAIIGYGALFKNRTFRIYAISLGCVSASFYVYLGGSAPVLIKYFAISPLRFSLIFAGIAFAMIMFGWLNIRLLKSRSVSHLMSAGLLLGALLCTALTVLTISIRIHLWLYAAFLALANGAASAAWSNGTALAMDETGSSAGMGSAVLSVVQSVFGATAGLLLAVTGLDPRGLALAMAIFAALGFLTRCLVPSNKEQTREQST